MRQNQHCRHRAARDRRLAAWRPPCTRADPPTRRRHRVPAGPVLSAASRSACRTAPRSRGGGRCCRATPTPSPRRRRSLDRHLRRPRRQGDRDRADQRQGVGPGAAARASGKGVKIVLYGTHMDADFPVAFIGTSDSRHRCQGTGKIAAGFIKEQAGRPRPTVAILANSARRCPSRATCAPMASSAPRAPAATRSDGRQCSQDGFLAEKAVAVASDILTAHPEVNVIYAANEGGTVGAVQAVRRAGLRGQGVRVRHRRLRAAGKLPAGPGSTCWSPPRRSSRSRSARKRSHTALAAIDGKPFKKADDGAGAAAVARRRAGGAKAFLAAAKQPVARGP